MDTALTTSDTENDLPPAMSEPALLTRLLAQCSGNVVAVFLNVGVMLWHATHLQAKPSVNLPARPRTEKRLRVAKTIFRGEESQVDSILWCEA